VVGGEHVEATLGERARDDLAVVRGLHRGVALDERAEARNS
jgi:hypothetical protein